MAEALEVELRADIKSFAAAMNQANQSLLKLTENTRRTSTATSQMANSFKAIGAGLVAAVFAKLIQTTVQLGQALADNAERAENFRASIGALRGSSEQGAQAMTKVYNTAQKLGASVEDVSGVFQKLTVALAPLGASNRDVERMTETLFKMGRIGGSSMADINGAVLQLAQAMGSGKLQGDELRSILERMPTLAQAIAKEMGVTTGALRKLGSDGKIGVNEVYGAIQKMADQVDKDFAKMPLTIGQAMNNIKTSLARAFDSPIVISAVQNIARAINTIPGFVNKASSAINTFGSNISRIFSDIAGVFQPAIDKIKEFLNQFSGLGSKVGSALSGFGNILKAALLGPLGLIIANYDQFLAFLTLKVPGELQKMVGSAGSVLASLVKVFEDAWNAIVSLVAEAINGIIAQINRLAGAANSVWQAGGGVGNIIPTLDDVDGKFLKVTGSVNGLKAASDGWYNAGIEGVSNYNRRLAELSRTTDETGERFREANLKGEQFKTTLDNIADASGTGGGGGSGGKGGKGGGAAKGLKAAGDAAKKAGEQMKGAQSQVEEFGEAMKGIAQSLGSGVVDALFAAAEGTKSLKESFAEMAKSILKQVAQMILQLLVLKPLLGMFGGGLGGIGGGLLGGLGRSAGGVTRSLGAAPRIAPGAPIARSGTMGSYGGFGVPANMNGSGGVTVNNYSNANVKTRQDNGQITIDIIEEVVADRIARGGNRIDASISRAFGVRRVGY